MYLEESKCDDEEPYKDIRGVQRQMVKDEVNGLVSEDEEDGLELEGREGDHGSKDGDCARRQTTYSRDTEKC